MGYSVHVVSCNIPNKSIGVGSILTKTMKCAMFYTLPHSPSPPGSEHASMKCAMFYTLVKWLHTVFSCTINIAKCIGHVPN